jgi:isoleucyl-tRNA synthetase
MILSEIVFGKKPFDSILVSGMVLDLGKKKMSKSLGNIVSPADVIEKYGRDYMRYYFAKFSKGEDFSYDEEEFADIGKVMMMIGNVNNFSSQLVKKKAKLSVEDKWILSKYNSLVKKVTESYNSYWFPDVVQAFEQFIVMDLSRKYIQVIRDRADETYDIMNEIRLGLIKLIAPICPYISEKIWQELREKNIVKEESVHLSEWPELDASKIDEKLEKSFDETYAVIVAGLRERDKVQIGLKWPLAKATIMCKESVGKELEEIIMRQLNVKKLEFKKGEEIKVDLDIRMTPELEAEGYSRELARKIQAERKNAGLKKGDLIKLKVFAEKEMVKMIEKHKSFLKERTNSEKLDILDISVGKMSAKAISFDIKGKKLVIEF